MYYYLALFLGPFSNCTGAVRGPARASIPPSTPAKPLSGWNLDVAPSFNLSYCSSALYSVSPRGSVGRSTTNRHLRGAVKYWLGIRIVFVFSTNTRVHARRLVVQSRVHVTTYPIQCAHRGQSFPIRCALLPAFVHIVFESDLLFVLPFAFNRLAAKTEKKASVGRARFHHIVIL
jgi:hypothetical protein